MPLSQASLNLNVTWALTRTNAGDYQDSKQGPESEWFNLKTLDVTVFNQMSTTSYTIASGASQDIDLTSMTNLVHETFSFAHVLSMIIWVTADEVTLKPGAATGLTWFFGGTNPTITIPVGGCFLFSLPATATGQVVDATHKILTLTATGALTTLVDVVILGSTS